MGSLKKQIEDLINNLEYQLSEKTYAPVAGEIKTAISALKVVMNHTPLPMYKSNKTDVSCFKYYCLNEEVVIEKYIGFDVDNISIPSYIDNKPVTRIGNNAFLNCAFLKTVTLSKNISVIESNAFNGCTSLENIYNTENIKYIGASAFYNCSSLQNIILSDDVKYIGREAFAKTSINTFVVPKNVKYLCYGTFMECSSLKSIYLHSDLIAIGDLCFSECRKLLSIEITEAIFYIGKESFKNCTSLNDVYVYSIEANWGFDVFSKTHIWQPDLRYNPRIISSPLTDVTIHCLPGSTIQEICRAQKIRNVYLDKKNTNTLINNPLKTHSIIGFNLRWFKQTKESIETINQVLTYLRGKELIIERTWNDLQIRVMNKNEINLDEFKQYMSEWLNNIGWLSEHSKIYQDLLYNLIRLSDEIS